MNVTRILAVAALAVGMFGGGLLAQASNPSKGQTPVTGAKPAQQGERREGSGGRGQDYKWWKDARIVKELALAPAQAAKIDKIYEGRQRKLQPQVEEWNRLRAELNQMMKERKAKPADIEALATKMFLPHFQIDISRSLMLYEMLGQLTPEQHEKFNQIEQMGRGRGMGPSGNPMPR